MRDRQHLYQQPVDDSKTRGRLADGQGLMPDAESQAFEFFRGECDCETCKGITGAQGDRIAKFESDQDHLKNLSTQLLEQTVRFVDVRVYMPRLL